jgi:hypothetical protein
MGKMNLQQKQMLELFKELIDSIESGATELLDLRMNISKEGIISLTIIAKDENE